MMRVRLLILLGVTKIYSAFLEKLLIDFKTACDKQNVKLLGKLATTSALLNNKRLPKPYLEEYLSIRSKRYKTEKTDTAFFLTEYRGTPNRIDASSVEKMVAKYSEDFKVRVTPHKLRHTLATRLYDATKSQVLVSHQLGHASTQVTDLYTHIVNDEQKNALDKL